jgi:TonB family protein
MSAYLIQYQGRTIHWDTQQPLALGFPYRFVFEKSLANNNIKVRDLKKSRWVEIQSTDIENEGFSFHHIEPSLRILPTQKKLSLPQDYQKIQVNLPVLPEIDTPTELEQKLEREYKSALKRSGAALMSLLLISFVMNHFKPKPKEEELIPEPFTKVILKKQVKMAKNTPSALKPDLKTLASGSKQKLDSLQKRNAQIAQAFRSQNLQSAVKGLLKGGMTKLLSQNAALLASPLNAHAAANFKNTDRALASATIVGLNTGKNIEVASLGGSGTGKAGVGYGKGAGAKVEGQGNGFVSLDLGNSTVEEGLTKEEVGRVIHAHMSEIRYCYESSMIRSPELQGRLILDFTINSLGKVAIASVKESSLQDPRLDDCIVRRLTKWQFPKPKGGVDVAVTYPFIFKTLGN